MEQEAHISNLTLSLCLIKCDKKFIQNLSQNGRIILHKKKENLQHFDCYLSNFVLLNQYCCREKSRGCNFSILSSSKWALRHNQKRIEYTR